MNDIMKIIKALEKSGILLKGVSKIIKDETKEQRGGFYSLTNIEINEYYKNEPRFNGVYSRNNLPSKIKKGAYIINLDGYKNTGTHWISLFVKANKVIYFDSFGIEHIPEEINKFIGNKRIKANIFRIQAYDSIIRYLIIR